MYPHGSPDDLAELSYFRVPEEVLVHEELQQVGQPREPEAIPESKSSRFKLGFVVYGSAE